MTFHYCSFQIFMASYKNKEGQISVTNETSSQFSSTSSSYKILLFLLLSLEVWGLIYGTSSWKIWLFLLLESMAAPRGCHSSLPFFLLGRGTKAGRWPSCCQKSWTCQPAPSECYVREDMQTTRLTMRKMPGQNTLVMHCTTLQVPCFVSVLQCLALLHFSCPGSGQFIPVFLPAVIYSALIFYSADISLNFSVKNFYLVHSCHRRHFFIFIP